MPAQLEAYERWQASRVDVAEATAIYQRSAIRRCAPLLDRLVDAIEADDVAALVAELVEAGKARETIRKTTTVLAMVLDHAGIAPNPARDHVRVRLPREVHVEINPPTAEHVEAVVRVLPRRYVLPTLVLDATGMRVGELERLTWADLDELRGRWRVSAAVSKTGRARWVTPPADLFAAVVELVPREDRVPERPVFEGFGADRYRTALRRACTAAGVPHFSPHDLRHRRISMLHLGGVPWARIGRARRAAEPGGDGEYLQPRARRRDRARLRRAARLGFTPHHLTRKDEVSITGRARHYYGAADPMRGRLPQARESDRQRPVAERGPPPMDAKRRKGID